MHHLYLEATPTGGSRTPFGGTLMRPPTHCEFTRLWHAAVAQLKRRKHVNDSCSSAEKLPRCQPPPPPAETAFCCGCCRLKLLRSNYKNTPDLPHFLDLLSKQFVLCYCPRHTTVRPSLSIMIASSCRGSRSRSLTSESHLHSRPSGAALL